MSKLPLKAIIAASLALTASSAFAKDNWEVSFGTGTALSYGENIKVKMNDGSTIDSGNVRFDTKPFKAPFYYDAKITKWNGDNAYEFEFIHHKLYAKSSDLNSRIQHFEITDGYNLLYGNYVYQLKEKWNARIGIGLVVPHPDVTIDGERKHGPYQLAGATAQLGLEREFKLNDTFSLSLESKMTYSYAHIDLGYGTVNVPNTAIHFIGSIKYSL